MSGDRISWPIKRIGELATVARGSSPRPIADERYFVGGEIPWIKIADATKSGKYLYETKEHVNEFGASFSRRLPVGSLIVAASGVSLGYIQMLGVSGCVHDGWLYLANFLDADKHYLYYFLKCKQQHFFNFSSGAAIQNINTEILRNTEIALPPLHIQDRIASVLSAYDDLIENNTRRIKILEDMAQMVYREWFVNFRFPGHENVRMVESELGPIPEGWTVRNLFDVAHVTYGFPFKSKLFTAGGEGIPVIRIRDIKSDFSNTFTTEEAEAKHIVKNGDLLVGMDGDFHMGKWAGGNAYLNQRVVRFRPKYCLSPYFIFLALEAPIKHFDSTIVGTTVAHLSDRDLRSTSLLMPSDDIVKKTAAVFDPLFSMEIGLKLKIANLRTTRDLLLPKLISGEISVEAADEAAAELMVQTA